MTTSKTPQKAPNQLSQQQDNDQQLDTEQDEGSLLGNAAMNASLNAQGGDDPSNSLLESEEFGLDLDDDLLGQEPDWAKEPIETILEGDEEDEEPVKDHKKPELRQPVDKAGGMKALTEHAKEARPAYDKAMKAMIADTGAQDDTRWVRERHKHDDNKSSQANAKMADEVYRLGKEDENGKRHKFS